MDKNKLVTQISNCNKLMLVAASEGARHTCSWQGCDQPRHL